MSAATLKRTKVSIHYTTSDGFSLKYEAKGGTGTKNLKTGQEVPAHLILIDAIGQLSRTAAMFGFEEEALAEFNKQRDDVLEWRKQGGTP